MLTDATLQMSRVPEVGVIGISLEIMAAFRQAKSEEMFNFCYSEGIGCYRTSSELTHFWHDASVFFKGTQWPTEVARNSPTL